MNCDILKIVRGNDFATQMTITALDAGGNVIEDFSLEDSTEVVVKYTLAGESHTIEDYDYNIEGNDITIQWSDLALGKYGFEIEGKFNGYSWRSAARFIFQIVADNASANIPDGVLVNGIYILNDWLRLLSGGGGGKQVQADWTETDTEAPSYIQHKPELAPVATSGSYNDLTNKPTIPDVSGKADKVSGAVAGDFAGLDANGNIIDSGKKASDFATAAQGAKADTAIQDISGKQDVLVSGTNIKTINNESILGSGNITIEGGGDVDSVNGKTGVVVLDAEDVGAASAEDLQDVADDVATNTQNIATLQAAYAGLTQSDIIIGALPSSGVANTIYRVPSTSSYSDYMWNGSQFVLMATYSGMFGDGVYDISAEHSGATYDNLTAALGVDGANVPSFVRKGGMSVKYIENIYAEYDVVVTDGLSTQPSGTALDSASSITDGTYKAEQLTDFSTLPTRYGSSITYYIAVVGSTTTYTQWVVTKSKDTSVKYVQYRLNESTFSTDITDWQKCVEDYDAIHFKMRSGVRVARADGQLASDTATEASDFIDIRGYDKIFITTKLYNAFSTANDSVVFVYDINGVPRIIIDPRDYSSQRQTQVNIIGKEYVVQENDAYIRFTNYVGADYANYQTPYVFAKKDTKYNTEKLSGLKVDDIIQNPIKSWNSSGSGNAFRVYGSVIIYSQKNVRVTIKLKNPYWRFAIVETDIFGNPNATHTIKDSGWLRYAEQYQVNASSPIICIRASCEDASQATIQEWENAISVFYMEYENSAERFLNSLESTNENKISISKELANMQVTMYPLNYEEVLGINHRGFNTVAPENTIPAFRLSAVNGFKYVETDVRFTSDSVAVLLHDATINRTARNADGSSISGNVYIKDITYEQALTYDFGIAKSADYAGTKIPTLGEFLLLCRNAKLCPFLEVKDCSASQIKQITDTVKEYSMEGRVYYTSPELNYILSIAEYDKSASLSLVLSSSVTQAIIDNLLHLKSYGHYVTIFGSSQASADIELCKSNGIPYILWTIDNESTIINANPYISGFVSNSLNATEVLYNSAIGE